MKIFINLNNSRIFEFPVYAYPFKILKMPKKENNYVKATPYEHFTRNAFACERGKHGGDVAHMYNLLEAEDGNKLSILPSYEKQLAQIKTWMLKAIDKYLMNKKISDIKKNKLRQDKLVISSADSSEPLLKVIRDFFDI